MLKRLFILPIFVHDKLEDGESELMKVILALDVFGARRAVELPESS